MVPAFKNFRQRCTAKIYRSAGLLPVVSKVFEKVINDRLVNHLKKYGFFLDFQYGFRSFGSTAILIASASYQFPL